MLRPESGSTSSVCSATATSSDGTAGATWPRMLRHRPPVDTTNTRSIVTGWGCPAGGAVGAPACRRRSSGGPTELAGDRRRGRAGGPRRRPAAARPPRPRGAVPPARGCSGGRSSASRSHGPWRWRWRRGPSQQGSWTAIVGVPERGRAGGSRARDRPGPVRARPRPRVRRGRRSSLPCSTPSTWSSLRPPARVRGADARRLAARARERGAVLVLLGGPGRRGPTSACR